MSGLPWGMTDKGVALTVATHILKGEVNVKWWRGGPEEDEILEEAAGVVLENIGDADLINRTKDETGKDMREQWTVEQLEQLEEDRRWWGWGSRRN